MTTLKIINTDNVVIVDGNILTLNVSAMLPANVWAVSYDGAAGEVEYSDATPNAAISDINDYAAILQLHADELIIATAAQQPTAAEIAAQADWATKMAGFTYNGTMVSFTAPDCVAVTQASIWFDKKDSNATDYVATADTLTLSFANGATVALNRLEFETQFLPAFFAQISPEFIS